MTKRPMGPSEQEAKIVSDLAADLLRQAVWGSAQNLRHPEPSALVHWANNVAREWADMRRKRIHEARNEDLKNVSEDVSESEPKTDSSMVLVANPDTIKVC